MDKLRRFKAVQPLLQTFSPLSASATGVAIGLILNHTRSEVFISQRRADQSYAGYWEFPGGKHEINETPFQSLQRELQEEVGIIVSQAQPFMEVMTHTTRLIHLHIWVVQDFSGHPSSQEGQKCMWARIDALQNYVFPEGNIQIIEQLQAGIEI